MEVLWLRMGGPALAELMRADFWRFAAPQSLPLQSA
jgi:hypothetical protein